MADKCVYNNLKINEDFKQLIPPLSSEELQQLEKNIVRDGCREPLSVWNNTILDGHNRYEICTRLHIPFKIQHIYFKNHEEATSWICANQLGRRNISEETRKYLIGKRYEMEKILGIHNAVGTNQYKKKEVKPKMLAEPNFHNTSYRTSERLGEEYRISHATVEKYGVYSNAMDALSKVVPDIVPKILSGEVKISHESLVEMSQLPPQDVRRLGKQISDNTVDFYCYSGIRKVLPKRQDSKRQPISAIPGASVKDMPVYDPDAEISSLALTIPSWVSSINRTRSIANLSEISNNARCKLEKELLELKATVKKMLTAIKEEK